MAGDVSASVATATAVVGSATVSMRSYLSSHQLWTARYFARQAKKLEEKHAERATFSTKQRAFVSAAVLSACAFMEAAINEVFQDVVDEHESYIQPLTSHTRWALAVYWQESDGKADILSKYQMALGLAGCALLDKGAGPYQSAKLVVQVRNQLVHFRPETASAVDVKRLEARLRARFPENPLAGTGNPYWPDKCLGSGCAAWAAGSARAFADEAFLRLALQTNYQRVSWPDAVD